MTLTCLARGHKYLDLLAFPGEGLLLICRHCKRPPNLWESIEVKFFASNSSKLFCLDSTPLLKHTRSNDGLLSD